MVVYPLYTADAFSSEPFKGNPAAVCLVPYHNDLTSEVMQKMAAEMNISETAYVTPVNENDTFQNGSRFKLRWFTPTVEVELCGHATLATATVIVQSIGNRSEFLHFETLSGTLTVRKGKDGKLIMDFPNGEPLLQDCEGFEDLIKVVVGDLPYSDVAFSPKTHKLLIRLDDSVTREQLESIEPLPSQLILARRDERLRGVIVTLKGDGVKNGCLSPSGAPYDFMSRYFAPWVGIPEDPVTGSAHTVLGPYWAKHLGKKELFACQCSKRIGELWVTLRNDNRVDISGSGYILFKGKITLP